MLSRPVSVANNFYGERLTGDARRIYDALVADRARGIMRTSVAVDDAENVSANASAALEAVNFGCAELFFVGKAGELSFDGRAVTLEHECIFPEDELDAYREALDEAVESFAASVYYSDDRGVLERLNEMLSTTVTGVDGREDVYGSAYGALVLGAARCEGYTKAAQILLSRCGIPSVMAAGRARSSDGREENHAWTIATVDGRDYSFDFTWNARRIAYGIPSQEYMFLPDSDMLREHFPMFEGYPKCTDASATFWARHGGELEFISDLAGVDIMPYGKHFFTMARLNEQIPPADERDVIFGMMQSELSPSSYGSLSGYTYNRSLGVVTFYFLNE